MFRKTASCWLTTLAISVVAVGTMASSIVPIASAAPADRSIVSVVRLSFHHGRHVRMLRHRRISFHHRRHVRIPRHRWRRCCVRNYSTHNTGSVPLRSPWGPAPITANSASIERYLFDRINHDRAIRGLYLYSWNSTLASGARLHSWNMAHCGFSHSCPDGDYHFGCMRITREVPRNNDCGECISTSWSNGILANQKRAIGSIQEGMVNEPDRSGSWHRIHLTSRTLHSIGVGVYISPDGWIYATEDMVS